MCRGVKKIIFQDVSFTHVPFYTIERSLAKKHPRAKTNAVKSSCRNAQNKSHPLYTTSLHAVSPEKNRPIIRKPGHRLIHVGVNLDRINIRCWRCWWCCCVVQSERMKLRVSRGCAAHGCGSCVIALRLRLYVSSGGDAQSQLCGARPGLPRKSLAPRSLYISALGAPEKFNLSPL